MTLRELMDVCESDITVSEREDYKDSFVTIKGLEYSSGADDYTDVFTQEFLDREICLIKATSETVLVCLMEANNEH